MKSIKQQYIDLKENKMSQANFMRNLRMTFPNLVTNVTSFDDSVKILRNKGILTEADIKENTLNEYEKIYYWEGSKCYMRNDEGDEKQVDTSYCKRYADNKMGDTGYMAESFNEMDYTAAEELAKDMGDYESAVVALEDKMGLSPQEANRIATKVYGEEDEDAIMAAIKKYEDEESGRYTTGGEQFEISEDLTDPSVTHRDPSILAKSVAEEYGEELLPLFNTRKAPGGYRAFENAAFQKAGEVAVSVGITPKVIKYYIGYDEDWVADYISALYKELETGEFGTEEKLFESKSKWENTSGKEMYDQFKEIDNLNGHELLIGLDWEMENNPELSKVEATKIVIKKLKKNPLYYTMWDLAGKEGAEAEYMGGKSADPEAHQMTPVKGENFIDKKRGMKPVKGIEKPKKDSDAATAQKYKTSGISLMSLVAKTVRGVKKMDPTGEKMKTVKLSEVYLNDSNPNATTTAAMQFIDSNPTLKAISNDLTIQNSHNESILKYGYWEPLPNNAISKLEMQFDVEEIYDFDEDTGTITAYSLALKGSPYKFPGLGQSPVEDRLAEQISQYIKERFDGMEPVPSSLKKMDEK